jgi:hypothetical protein
MPSTEPRVGESVVAPASRLAPVKPGGGKPKPPDPNAPKPPPPDPNAPKPVYKRPPPPPEKKDKKDKKDKKKPGEGEGEGDDDDDDKDDEDPDDGKEGKPEERRDREPQQGRGEKPDTPTTHTCGAAGKKPEFVDDILRDLRRDGKLSRAKPKSEADVDKLRDAARDNLDKIRRGPVGRDNDDASGRLVTRVLTPPKIDWGRYLKNTLASAVNKLARRGRPSWGRLSRRTYGMWGTSNQVLEPARRGNVKGWDVALIVDTSASVGEKSLGVCLKEAAMLLVHPKIARVFFVASDWASTASEEIMVSQIKGNRKAAEERLLPLFIGDRGSDVTGAVQEVVAISKKRQSMGQPPIPVCVIFTDGDITWPPASEFGSMEVVVVLLPSHWGGQRGLDRAVKSTERALKGVRNATVIRGSEGDGA